MDHQQDNEQEIARQQEIDERKEQRRTIEEASAELGRILARHKAGEPVLAEMAARIAERTNDPFGLRG